jgi:hypothetical protein
VAALVAALGTRPVLVFDYDSSARGFLCLGARPAGSGIVLMALGGLPISEGDLAPAGSAAALPSCDLHSVFVAFGCWGGVDDGSGLAVRS